MVYILCVVLAFIGVSFIFYLFFKYMLELFHSLLKLLKLNQRIDDLHVLGVNKILNVDIFVGKGT